MEIWVICSLRECRCGASWEVPWGWATSYADAYNKVKAYREAQDPNDRPEEFSIARLDDDLKERNFTEV